MPWPVRMARGTKSGCRRATLPSENQLDLPPHAANATVGEIAIEEAARPRLGYPFCRHLKKLWMIERVSRFPAKFQPASLTHRKRSGKVQIEVVCAAGVQRIAAHSGGIGQSDALYPAHIAPAYAGPGVRIQVTGGAASVYQATAVPGRGWIADIRPIGGDPIVVPVRSVSDGVRSPRLKRSDARDRPSTQGVFRKSRKCRSW